MKWTGWLVLIYSLIVLIGGIIGHQMAGSMASLIAGSLFGVLLLVSASSVIMGHDWAIHSALVLTAFLTLFFGYRFIFTHKWMPAGIMFFISTAVLVVIMTVIKRVRRPTA
jgi:uncharacterized membrane protein (UPF0136 family)